MVLKINGILDEFQAYTNSHNINRLNIILSKRGRYIKGNFWGMREGIRAKSKACHSWKGPMLASYPYLMNTP